MLTNTDGPPKGVLVRNKIAMKNVHENVTIKERDVKQRARKLPPRITKAFLWSNLLFSMENGSVVRK